MHFHQYTTIGTHHLQHNEDALVVAPLSDHQYLLAVMDGCSMGTESHFAATLIAKALRKIAKTQYYRAFAEKAVLTDAAQLEVLTGDLFSTLQSIQQTLQLTREELLSTLVLAVLDTDKRTAEVLTVGDGLICCNGQFTEYDQDNQPDYLGYHLQEDFAAWWQRQPQRLSLSDIHDISITTDGIFTFRPFTDRPAPSIATEDLLDFLLINREDTDHERTLHKRMLEIERAFSRKPTDDLSIVRVIF